MSDLCAVFVLLMQSVSAAIEMAPSSLELWQCRMAIRTKIIARLCGGLKQCGWCGIIERSFHWSFLPCACGAAGRMNPDFTSACQTVWQPVSARLQHQASDICVQLMCLSKQALKQHIAVYLGCRRFTWRACRHCDLHDSFISISIAMRDNDRSCVLCSSGQSSVWSNMDGKLNRKLLDPIRKLLEVAQQAWHGAW